MNRAPQLIATFTLLGLCLIACADKACADELIRVDQALKKSFPQATGFDKTVRELTAGEIAEIEIAADITFAGSHTPTIIIYKARQNNRTIGYAFEDTVIGKWGPIHYLLSIDTSGRVIDTIILDYQEIRGKPVAKRRFLRQYNGKSAENPVQLQKDIDGISGATISSRSLTDGIRKHLHLYRLIKQSL